MTPGFIDSHIHFLMGGERLSSVKLRDVKSKQEFIDSIGAYAKTLKEGEWIIGGDWDHISWDRGLPSRFDIDSVTERNPVWIGRHEGHMYLANTLALKLAGLLDKELEKIEGGTVDKLEDG
jgi:predicted amidohydrolase YtcJ